jgi:hypothetical protein
MSVAPVETAADMPITAFEIRGPAIVEEIADAEADDENGTAGVGISLLVQFWHS